MNKRNKPRSKHSRSTSQLKNETTSLKQSNVQQDCVSSLVSIAANVPKHESSRCKSTTRIAKATRTLSKSMRPDTQQI